MYKLKGDAFGTVNNNQKLNETPGDIATGSDGILHNTGRWASEGMEKF
jgi:hypothetical protein